MADGGKKRVLVLAVEPVPDELDDLNPAKPNPGDLRPLLKVMHDLLSPKAHFKALVGPLAHLKAEARKKLDTYEPDAIVSIASTATEAAKWAVDNKYGSDPKNPNRTPIVFTVVSDPEGQRFVRRDPATKKCYGNRITGVSRSLVQTVVTCAKDKFAPFFPADGFKLYWVHRQNVYQSDQADGALRQGLPPTIRQHRIDLQASDWPTIESRLKTELQTESTPPRAGFLLIPDDLMVACADACLKLVQKDFNIPVFVEQPELVCPDWGTRKNYALGGFGVSPDWVGQRAADYVGQVLQAPDKASTLPVVFPHEMQGPASPFEFWVNKTVANGFQLAIPSGAKTCPPAPVPSKGAAAGAPAGEAAPKSRQALPAKAPEGPGAPPARAAKKPAKQKPARKRKAARKGGKAGRPAKAKKTAGRRKRTARPAARRRRR